MEERGVGGKGKKRGGIDGQVDGSVGVGEHRKKLYSEPGTGCWMAR